MTNRRVFLSFVGVLAVALLAFARPGTLQAAKQDPDKIKEKSMLDKVVYVTVFIKDQDKALDFYTNVLGFEKRVENPTLGGPRFLTVGLRGQDLQLVLWPGTPGQ